ncbi:DinB family protein [Roseivivax sediminis]|uniref:Uncharacterized damage-inducible protein DinB (Forms a four-helix bundle) n=1 Tax=Roseivivax sediminis TaxID=936889 RepID=A0A1I1SLA2_9RHOB|nr:DinB family protein [Roseivivax sediminis]SFD44663.1 Uncharacterized damage-inducible protein DinB (forms a four-helix bundle) [Roseivivax sediminis]
MVDTGYCVEMARYNAWQNRQIKAALKTLTEADLTCDRGAVFGSILGTLNHVLWADTAWMARFTGGAPPRVGLEESPDFTDGPGAWEIARFRRDAAILHWAERLRNVELGGTLSWTSAATGRTETKSRALCVVHMFNHQTHHRGQVHAMLSQAGAVPPVSDLAFMPEGAGIP